MLVDPSTGEPVSLSTTALGMSGESSSGFLSAQAAMGMGAEPTGRFVGALEHMPSASHVVGWNAMRGSQTILRGARTSRKMKASLRAGANVTFNPRHWLKLPTYDALDTKARGDKGYTPFQLLSGKWSNNRINSLAKRSSFMQKMLTDSQIDTIKGGQNIDMVGGGFMSRLTASARIGWSNQKRAAKIQTNIAKFVKGSGEKELYSNLTGVLGKNFASASPADLAHAQMSTVRGAASQYVGGYMQSAMLGTENATMKSFLSAGIKQNYTKGALKATEHFAGAGLKNVGGRVIADMGSDVGKTLISEGIARRGGTVGLRGLAKAAGNTAVKEAIGSGAGKAIMKAAGAKMAGMAGMAIPGLNVVLTAMMVHDLTEMGIAGLKGTAEFGKDAMKSFQGAMYKPVMGMGYRDTEVAATSRQRGTMAIQSSRLNARSVLGNEASGMAAHFG